MGLVAACIRLSSGVVVLGTGEVVSDERTRHSRPVRQEVRAAAYHPVACSIHPGRYTRLLTSKEPWCPAGARWRSPSHRPLPRHRAARDRRYPLPLADPGPGQPPAQRPQPAVRHSGRARHLREPLGPVAGDRGVPGPAGQPGENHPGVRRTRRPRQGTEPQRGNLPGPPGQRRRHVHARLPVGHLCDLPGRRPGHHVRALRADRFTRTPATDTPTSSRARRARSRNTAARTSPT